VWRRGGTKAREPNGTADESVEYIEMALATFGTTTATVIEKIFDQNPKFW
jgi:hypothetical protein